ncbi:MAG: flagellar filament capping protein FliD [Planctomycetota bacterium]|jgi:flagellar hook-associated protein 2
MPDSISGLISGMDTASIIEGQLAIERRPIQKIETKVLQAEAEQEAYRSVNSLLLEFKAQVDILGKLSSYNGKLGSSSNEDLLSVTALDSAQVGTYNFRTVRTSQTHQMMSGGFTDLDDTLGAGEIRVDAAGASLLQSTKLASLNGDNGINRGSIKLTDRAGMMATVDLSTAETVDEVIEMINLSGVDISAAVGADGKSLELTDYSGGAGNLTVEEVGAGSAAEDLGIYTGGAGIAASTLSGQDIFSLQGSTAVTSLRDGRGIDDGSLGSIRITDNDGAPVDYDIDLSKATTLQDIIDAVDADTGGVFSASISGDGRSLVISSGTVSEFAITNDAADAHDQTATDLGIATASSGGTGSVTGSMLIGGMNTVMVDSLSGAGGAGIDLSTFDITDRDGNTTTIDLTGAVTLQNIIDTINTTAAAAIPPVRVEAGLNKAGNGIEIKDLTGGAGNLIIQNSGGSTTATDLGIETAVAGVATDELKGADLDRKYISRATRLEDLNGGQGIDFGSIRLIDGNGNSAVGDLTGLETVGEVMIAINSAGLNISARINDTGDGILLENTLGTGQIKVEEVEGGNTAEDLGLLGTAPVGGSLDGSFEKVVTIGANDTLRDVALKLGISGLDLSASVLDDGSGVKPYHLSLTSSLSGAAGMMVIDTDIAGLDFTETSKAQDALLLYGSGAGSMLMANDSNTFASAIPGMQLTINSADVGKTVTVNVERDTQKIVDAASEMTTKYNNVAELVSVLTRWDVEEEAGGLLFGDSRLTSMMNELSSMVNTQANTGNKAYSLWYDIGIKFNYNSEKKLALLEVDDSTLREALEQDFEAVTDLMAGNTDTATKGMNASISVDNTAGGGTDVENLINGNTLSSEFGVTNGYEATYALDDAVNNPDGKDVFTINLESDKPVYQIVLNHIDSVDMPASDYAISDFLVEYFDKATESWTEARRFTGNRAAVNYLTLPDGTQTDQLRVTVTGTNAPDKKARLMEITAYEQAGVASQMREGLGSLSNAIDGLFVTANQEYNDKIKNYQSTIEDMEERITMKEVSMLREWSAMESALAQITQQGDFFMTQMNAINNKGK